jgi:hypothetical protein
MRSRLSVSLVTAAVLSVVAVLLPAGPAAARGVRGGAEPVPIPGGIQIPDGPLIHVFAPGPVDLGFMGENVEPNTITNFDGFAAMAYIAGTATDADGNTYAMFNDMRVYQGTYVAADGSVNFGTFAFI